MVAKARVEEVLRSRCNDPFFIDATTSLSFTYGEMFSNAERLADIFTEAGLVPGDRIAIFLDNSVEFAVIYLACLISGTTAVPVNTSLHGRDIAHIFAKSRVKLLIIKPADISKISGYLAPEIQVIAVTKNLESADFVPRFIWSVAPSCGTPSGSYPKIDDSHVLSITFTSGTTSDPKGVVHTVGSLFRAADMFNKAHGFSSKTRIYHVFSMAYMAGFLNTLLCPLLAGGSVVSAGVFDAKLALRFWSGVQKWEVNTLWIVPTMMAVLVRLDRDPDAATYCRAKIRTVCVGTAPLPTRIRSEFEEKYSTGVHESFGLSETLFVSSGCEAALAPKGSVGKLLPGVEMRIVNDQGEALPSGDDGEILIRSESNMLGYLDADSGQVQALGSGAWFPTGDIGHIDLNGYLNITSRKKDIVIRGGTNISPRAIEEVLMQHPDVAQAAVVGLPHDFYGEEVVAVVRLQQEAAPFSVVKDMLLASCRTQLNSLSVPTQIHEMSEFPSTSTGKVQKGAIKKLLQERLLSTVPI